MIKQLNKVENAIFIAGAILIVAGVLANILNMSWAPYLFSRGVAAFVLMQFKQSYEGTNISIIRLRQMLIFSDVLFIATAFLMFANQENMFGFNALTYAQYIPNNWVVTLFLAALLQLYSYFRIDKEIAKEEKKS